MAHLRGSMKQVFSLAVFPATGKTTDALAGDPWAVVNVTELSPACSTALVQRMIEEGEDIRLNYRWGGRQAACQNEQGKGYSNPLRVQWP